MARAPATAVIDIGKSNAKLALVDAATRMPISVHTTANRVLRDGPYPHYDVDGLWSWLLDGLRACAAEADIATISIATHGAAFALLAGDRLALPILDYEYAGPESLNAAYRDLRGDFAETLSPDLPVGLNAGRQIFWQSRTFPTEFATVDAILPYPQYWAWRLSGGKAAEATSLGCHTDLWNPRLGTFSRLAIGEGWDRLFPPLVRPWDTVGTVRAEVAAATGISATARVVAGIHDSNASLLPHLLTRPQPFAVLSSGTWMIVFAPGGSLDGLDRGRDCLANVDAFGHAVPSARFMAGREYATIAGDGAVPSDAEMEAAIAGGIMVLPTFAPGTGPFGSGEGRWSHDPSRLSPGLRAAAAALYAALVTETCLDLAGADGPVLVEGPFAGNRPFLAALACLVGRPVLPRLDATGTTEGAALLAEGPAPRSIAAADPPAVTPLAADLSAYRAAWRDAAGRGGFPSRP